MDVAATVLHVLSVPLDQEIRVSWRGPHYFLLVPFLCSALRHRLAQHPADLPLVPTPASLKSSSESTGFQR
jgi:hypothetical protein